MIKIIISNTSEKPIYQQIFDQISSQVIKGELESNSGLPPIRTIAKELRVSVITIKKAWEELERKGFIYSMVGRGCFVSDLTKSSLTDIRNDLAGEKMEKDISYYKSLGFSLEDIITLLKSKY